MDIPSERETPRHASALWLTVPLLLSLVVWYFAIWNRGREPKPPRLELSRAQAATATARLICSRDIHGLVVIKPQS